MRWLIFGFGGLIAVLALIWVFGPREAIIVADHRVTPEIPEDIEGWLASRERQVPDIVPGAEAEIVWANPGQPAKTDIAIVYLHGFSATKHEIRPVPDRLAQALGANLFYARLAGHGVGSAGLGAATADQMMADTATALAIGRQLGKRVLVVGTSTGATLGTVALADPVLSQDVAGFIAVSPNFRVQALPMALLTMPFAADILPLAFGAEYSWEPANEAQGKWWTTSYPSRAIIQMATIVDAVDHVDLSAIKVPALFIFSDQDEVVVAAATRNAIASWGGATEVVNVTPGPGDSPSAHVIAGDIVSPGLTDVVAEAAENWSRKLQ